MTSVLTPILSESTPHNQAANAAVPEGLAVHKQDTREYLADMLKELSAIAAWAELDRAQHYIDAALHEVEARDETE
ncbi:MAG: hypothetical protein ACLPIX_17190 [Rhodomicrobium sp.]